jgi:general stress protein 26
VTEDTIQQLQAHIDAFREVILVTHAADGQLHGRPMALAGNEDTRILWLVTSRSSPKVEEIAHDGRVFVSMQGKGRFVTLNGTARLVVDENKAAELWSPTWRVWFSSPQDPELVLVRIHLEEGAYWDRRGRAGIKAMLQMAQRVVLDRDAAPEDDPDQHARVGLDS